MFFFRVKRPFDTLDNQISVLSLIVAALAVFVGPVVSWAVAREQIRNARLLMSQQIVGPMRQAWINTLRQKIAEFLSSALHYSVAGFDERSDAEYQRLTLLEQEIVLTVNPNEADHQELIQVMSTLLRSLSRGVSMPDEGFLAAHDRLTGLAQGILKTEWNRVRDGV